MGKLMRKPLPVGSKFGRWTTIAETFVVGGRKLYVRCRCECGNEAEPAVCTLRNGRSRSCGCIRAEKFLESVTKHGLCEIPEHQVWADMRIRCSNPRHRKYPNYGGRGIKVCERWDDFANFIADMGRRPEGSHPSGRAMYTLERINNDGDYEPGNCRWACYAEQNRNHHRNRLLTHNGKTMCMTDWAAFTGMTVNTIRKRLTNGWSVHDTLSVPMHSVKSYRKSLRVN